MAFDYSKILEARTAESKNLQIQEYLETVSPDNPPVLSDIIANIGHGGEYFLEVLGRMYADDVLMERPRRFTWTIQVLKDQWGNKPRPGDIAIRKLKNAFNKSEGKLYTSRELSAAKMDGTYDKRFEHNKEFPLDERGCFKAGFEDAVAFLNTYGIHYKTGQPIGTTIGKPEKMDPYEGMQMIPGFSHGPAKSGQGSYLHVHYWRFKEVPPDVYKDLPKINGSKEPKRGWEDPDHKYIYGP